MLPGSPARQADGTARRLSMGCRGRERRQREGVAENLSAMTSPEELSPPMDVIASSLEDTGWAAEVYDADWRLVYATTQLRDIIGAEDDGELGIGRHIPEGRRGAPLGGGRVGG